MADQTTLPATITPQEIKTGMMIRVHQKIKELDPNGKEKERVQIFAGLVLNVGGAGVGKTMTVRKLSDGVGVERIYPLLLPSIQKIELMRVMKTRRKSIGFVRHSKKALREVKRA